MPPNNVDHSWNVQVKLDADVKADGPLSALLQGDKTFDSWAPQKDTPGTEGGAGDRPRPHIVWASPTQVPSYRFGRAANASTLTFQIKGAHPGSKKDVIDILSRMRTLFDEKAFPITNGFVEWGRIESIAIVPDPAGGGMLGTFIYRFRVRSA